MEKTEGTHPVEFILFSYVATESLAKLVNIRVYDT